MRCLRWTIQLQWTSFFTVINPQKLHNLLVFTSFCLGAPNLGWLRVVVLLIGLWKNDFFFISGNWAGDLIDVNNASFLPFASALSRLRLEGMFFFLCFGYFIWSFPHLILFCVCVAITRPHLDKLNLDCIDRAHAYSDRSFHSLVTLHCLAVWGLGLKPTDKNLAHEEITRRSKCRPFIHHLFITFFF